ncbi:MAG: glycyl-radical enzyme activating protein [Lachnospiraceae bacterium]|nr:glycyl-radical enzyme activating protein [Lachnospiraceae bacterium]
MLNLNVSHIQFFSTGDGPGIRSTVFLKGCNLRCPWCHNPETIEPAPQTLSFPGTGKHVLYGKNMPVEEVVETVMGDLDFYKASQGGVTISGGEPMLQPEGVAELCRRLRQLGVSTLIDTAGNVPWEHFERVLPYTDCFFYDFKSPDERVYREIVRGNPKLIWGNLKKLSDVKAALHVRIPLIPGVNDDDGSLERSAALLADMGVRNVDLLPFHRMGGAKYQAMGLSYAYQDTHPLSGERVREIRHIFERNFAATVES